jgi:hypothetical protein
MNSHGLTLVSQIKHINDFCSALQVARHKFPVLFRK